MGGGAGGKSGGGSGGAEVGVQCKETPDGCNCLSDGKANQEKCGKGKHPNAVCCPSSNNWPAEGTCSCLEIRSQATASGCSLVFSTDPTAPLVCESDVCCLSADKLACQCFKGDAQCPAGQSKVPSCTPDKLGCGDTEALSDCVP